jgi:inner membrane protein
MDNATHAFVGLAVGELIHRLLPEERDEAKNKTRRGLLLFMCCAASNFPDLDLVLYPLLAKPLGYLLHHRGHSHTFLWEIPQAILLLLGTMILWPRARRLVARDKPARLGMFLTLVLGFILHISMDYLNSYGVHPFAPFDSHWYYGDMVFIIEPIFWSTLGVAVVTTFKNRFLKVFWLLFLLGIPIYATYKQYLPAISLTLLLLAAGAVVAIQSKAKPRDIFALAFSVLAAFVFVIAQGFASSAAKSDLRTHLEAKDATFRVLDSAVNSFPSNPLCWSFTSISVDEHLGTYRVRNGVLSLKPSFLSVKQCSPALFRSSTTVVDSMATEADDVLYFSEFNGNLAETRKLYENDCNFNAWMRFARMPFVTSQAASDMRFSMISPRGNFTTLDFETFKNQACPTNVPQWIPPREDLLN